MGTIDEKDLGVTIVINEMYHIVIDNIGNHTLYKKKVKKEGNNIGGEYNDVLGYYSSVSTALKGLLQDELISTKQTMALEEYIYELEKTYASILKQLDQIGDRITKKVAITKNKKEVK